MHEVHKYTNLHTACMKYDHCFNDEIDVSSCES
jgi:hypothetical protein